MTPRIIISRNLFRRTLSTSTTHKHKRSNFSNLSTPPPFQPYNEDPSDTTHFGYQSIPSSEKEKMVKQVFRNVSSSYDVMNDLMSLGIHRYWKDELCSMTYVQSIAKSIRELNEGEFSILDVAGGTGDVAFRFVEASGMVERAKSSGKDPVSVTVCDINPYMLKVGEGRAEEFYGKDLLTSGNLHFQEGNAECLPFEANTFDLYTIAFGLRNVTNVTAALEDAKRVLKPGGRFLCLEFSHIPNHLLQTAYDFYSFNAIPKIGKMVANDEESYQYLVESIRKFDTQQELQKRMESVGFEGVKYTNMTQGIVAVHQGYKPL